MKRTFLFLLCLFLLLACIPTLSACDDDPPSESAQTEQSTENTPKPEDRYYILNTATKKYHRTDCSYLPSAANSKKVLKTQMSAYKGYSPCQHCDP
ncbi:MAG: hypothetical protein J6B09_06705 [Clostridia bacterium]|nr:hypothetical protein [Clostridia bacterium]